MAGVGWICGRAAVPANVSSRAFASGITRAAIRHHGAGVRMTHADLEEALSRPSERDIEFLRGLEGDILILGAGGKMGPALARLCRRAADAAGRQRQIIAVSRRPISEAGVEAIA